MILRTVLLVTTVIFSLASQSLAFVQQNPATTQQSTAQEATPEKITIEILAQSSSAWDGTPYTAYPSGQPLITVLRMTIAPHTTIDWHTHSMPTAAYVLSGALTVEKKDGTKKHFGAGEVVVEIVDTIHRGFTDQQPATLIVFYPGTPGRPLSEAEK